MFSVRELKYQWALFVVILLACLDCAGCTNAPYPASERSGSVRFSAIAEDPKTLDPNVAYDTESEGIVASICDTFLQYQYLKRNPVELIPSMGARMPERKPYTFIEKAPVLDKDGNPMIGPNGKIVVANQLRHGEIWTFTIKHGLHYADDPCFPGGKGREVLASDFVYSLKRIADPSIGCPIFSYLAPHVLGLQDFFDRESDRQAEARKQHKRYVCDLMAPVAGLQTDPKDPYTFRIILRDHYPELKYLMAMPLTAPIPHEAIDYYTGIPPRPAFRQHPVGAGPYYLKEWFEGERIVLERNPNYHTDVYPSEGMPGDRRRGLLNDAGKPLPFEQKIVFTVIKESIPGWNLFMQGYLDVSGVPREAFNRVVSPQGSLSPEMKKRGIRMETAPGLDIWYLGFNMEDPLVGGYTLKKRELRQALSLAVNTREFLDIVLNGRGIPAQSVIPPGLFGYDPKYKNPYRQTNLIRAKKLLAEAGYPGGIDPSTGRPLEIFYDDTSTTPDDRQVSGLIRRQLQQLGVRIVERSWTFTVFQDRVSNGQFQMMSFGWVADYPDPENFLLLFYGPNKGPGPNATRYNRPAYDRLYRKMAAMDNSPERLKIIQQMQAMIQRDCPMIPVYHSLSYILRQGWVKNAIAHPVAMNTMKYVRIDSALRFKDQQKWNRPDYLPPGILLLIVLTASLWGVLSSRKRRSASARMLRQMIVQDPWNESLTS